MKKCLLLIFVLLFSPLYAKSSDKAKVGIAQLGNKNLKKAIALTVTDLFRNELVRFKKFDILERDNMKRLLKELTLQQTGITDSSTAVKMGKMLNLRYMFFGSVARLNKKYIITIEMVDIETSKIISSVNRKFKDIDYVDNVVKSLVREIVYNQKSDRVKLSSLKDPVKIKKRLIKKYCSKKSKYKKYKVLGYISSYDAIIEKPYSFLVYETISMPSRNRELKIASNQLVSTVFRKRYIKRTARKAYKAGKSYKTYGAKMLPSKGNKRHIEYRIYQKNGVPDYLEIYIVTRNNNWKAKSPKTLKIELK